MTCTKGLKRLGIVSRRPSASIPNLSLEFGTGVDLLSYVIPFEHFKSTDIRGLTALRCHRECLSPCGLIRTCAFCMKTLIAVPLAKLISAKDAMEVTILQDVQENLCAGTQYRQITR